MYKDMIVCLFWKKNHVLRDNYYVHLTAALFEGDSQIIKSESNFNNKRIVWKFFMEIDDVVQCSKFLNNMANNVTYVAYVFSTRCEKSFFEIVDFKYFTT